MSKGKLRDTNRGKSPIILISPVIVANKLFYLMEVPFGNFRQNILDYLTKYIIELTKRVVNLQYNKIKTNFYRFCS